MILDVVNLVRPVRLALLALISPGIRRLDPVGRIVGEGQRNRSGGSDREQVAVTNAMSADLLAQRLRQPGGKARCGQILIAVEQGKRTLLLRQFHRSRITVVPHALGNTRRHPASFFCVVAQTQHDQGIAKTGEAKADAALVARLLFLLG